MNLRPELPGSLIDSNISLDDMRKALELGRIGQLGFLVADVPDACRHFRERFGIRTWYVPEIHGAKFFHHDEPIEQVFSIAIAYFGGYQIEVLSVSGADQSLLGPPPESGQMVLHHIGCFVRDVETHRRRYQDRNLKEIQHGEFSFARRSKTRFTYFDTASDWGTNLEFIENRFRNRCVHMPHWLIVSASLFGMIEKQRLP